MEIQYYYLSFCFNLVELNVEEVKNSTRFQWKTCLYSENLELESQNRRINL